MTIKKHILYEVSLERMPGVNIVRYDCVLEFLVRSISLFAQNRNTSTNTVISTTG